MKRYLFALALAAVAGTAQARVEADPSKSYVVTPADGAWMICAADFRGETAPSQAHALVLEIRSQYDLAAFVYDRTELERQKQREEIEKQRQQVRWLLEQRGVRPEDVRVPIRTTRIEEECVVLVGSYKDMDSARNALDDIRKLTPKSVAPKTLNVSTSPAGSNPFSPAVATSPLGSGEHVEKRTLSPFANSFVVHNPTVAVERPSQKDEDEYLRRLNSCESYSIYKCRKPWTLAVATYNGLAVVVPKSASTSFVEKLFGGGNDQLGAAAQNAHNLAEALHRAGFDAYVFHTRYRSVVAVGGFDSRDDRGMRETHQAVMTRFKRDPKVSLPFFDEVAPMEVPH
jgi:hypothetical protein